MLPALTAIFLCQLVGEMITAWFALPLPGPVIGMALLFAGLMLKGEVPDAIGKVGDGLLQHLSLLFVPAGAGIMMHVHRLEADALGLGTALIVSTLATIAVTGLAMRFLTGRRDDADAG